MTRSFTKTMKYFDDEHEQRTQHFSYMSRGYMSRGYMSRGYMCKIHATVSGALQKILIFFCCFSES